MKVLLKKDVENLGTAGEVRSVSDGYGRNYLLPNGLALLATVGTLKQAENWRKKADAHRAELRAEFESLSARIREVRLVFQARAGETGKLYGSITTAAVADALNEKLGTEIDRRKVGVEPLRQLGEHQVVVRLSGDYHPELTVVIEPEAEEENEPVVVGTATETEASATETEASATETEATATEAVAAAVITPEAVDEPEEESEL